MDYKMKILVPAFLILSVLLVSGCGCKDRNARKYNLKLEVWGMLDDKEALSEIFDNYKKINPSIAEIEYKKISADTYKKELLEALASGLGPDIFMIHNDWVPNFKNKIVPAPKANVTGLITEQKFQQNFADAAIFDFVEKGEIYAVPLSIDSLGLYYNKDLFNQAGIVAPPKTWNEFIEDVRKITQINAFGDIMRAGAAIGTAYGQNGAFNINRATDILNLIMLQYNTQMSDDQGRVTFDRSVSIDGEAFSPGEAALNFYTQFAKSGSLNYTWNSRMHYSIDAFSEGTAAMMFNYSWHKKTIDEKAPKLNYAIAPVPQFENGNNANFPNYWGYAVAKNKKPVVAGADQNPELAQTVTDEERAGEAWLLLSYLATKPDGSFKSVPVNNQSFGAVADPNFDPAASYIKKMKVPAARRDLIETQKSDPWLGVFASGNLIAKSWKMQDPDETEKIFAEMINQVNRGQATVNEAIRTAAQRVGKLSSIQ